MTYTFEEVEAWIKRNRDKYSPHVADVGYWHYWTYDYLLDDLRLHWATGTPLTEEAHEGYGPDYAGN